MNPLASPLASSSSLSSTHSHTSSEPDSFHSDTHSQHTITPALALPHRTSSSSSLAGHRPHSGPSRSSSSDSTALEDDDLDDQEDNELGLNGPGPHHPRADPRLQWESSWDEQDASSLSPSPDRALSSEPETPSQRRERRRRERRTYGGARHRHGRGGESEDDDGELDGGEEGGAGLGVSEVGAAVMAGTLSPFPLLVPLACARLGPALFVPLLAVATGLAWLSGVVVGAEGRYVGARSFPALASAVFPHRLKLHLLGELLAALFVLAGSVVRTALGVVAAAEVAVDLLVPEQRRRDWERETAVVGICAVWCLVPLVVPFLWRLSGLDTLFYSAPSASSSRRPSSTARYSRLASTSSPDLAAYPSSSDSSAGPDTRTRPRWMALLDLPASAVAFVTWPVALLILGVRLKRLNRDAASPSSSLGLEFAAQGRLADLPLFSPQDAQGSLWPSILLTFAAALGSSHEVFFYLTSLARPSSTAAARRARSGTALEVPESSPGGGGAPTRRDREGKRNQYPLALATGHGLAFLVHLGWALVGTLGFSAALSPPSSDPDSDPDAPRWTLPTGDLLSDPRLPRGDPYLAAVRGLVLCALVAQLAPHARLAQGRTRRALAWAASFRSSRSSSAAVPAWRRPLSRLLVWAATAALAWVVVAVPGPAGAGGGKTPREVGGHGTGLVYAAEWVGVVGAGVGGCVAPALAYLVLFHLRAPRSIFTSSPSSPLFSTDALLARKERQLQRRLSGRRLWTDAGVFGLLLPAGLTLVGRGAWALVR
ncbi:hypothetical protein JCM10207_002034 [Rhodosporidiobolus poonsookiae]